MKKEKIFASEEVVIHISSHLASLSSFAVVDVALFSSSFLSLPDLLRKFSSVLSRLMISHSQLLVASLSHPFFSAYHLLSTSSGRAGNSYSTIYYNN